MAVDNSYVSVTYCMWHNFSEEVDSTCILVDNGKCIEVLVLVSCHTCKTVRLKFSNASSRLYDRALLECAFSLHSIMQHVTLVVPFCFLQRGVNWSSLNNFSSVYMVYILLVNLLFPKMLLGYELLHLSNVRVWTCII